MNILYVTNLTGNLFAGPNYSVPAQILAQSVVDNVFWYNLSQVKRLEWAKGGLNCKNRKDYASGRLADLPIPFNKPDIAVVECLYCFPFSKIITDLQNAGIPYIIVPRSAMTKQAQYKRRWKKTFGNLVWFNKMIRKAAAIQYLTEEERLESVGQWKMPCFVIPNGITRQSRVRECFSQTGILATYIGRFEIYQKGLDLLLQAIAREQTLLRTSGFRLKLYGQNQENTLEKLTRMIDEYDIRDLVSLHGPVFDEKKREVLLNTDVFIMTSRFEGHPMGMIEALSYGLPCFATLGTNLKTEIEQYQAGWTADNNVDSICQTLQMMVEQRNSFAEMGKNALRLAEQYAWEEIARKSHQEYERILGDWRK